MILEKLCIPDIAPEGIHGLVTRNVHHLEYRRAIARSRRQKAGSKRMAGEQGRVEACGLGVGLDDIGYRSVAETARRHHAAFFDRPEYRPRFDVGGFQPGLERLYRASSVPTGNSDGFAFGFLIRLAAVS